MTILLYEIVQILLDDFNNIINSVEYEDVNGGYYVNLR